MAARMRMAEMAKRTKTNGRKEPDEPASAGESGITRIMVRDFKSLAGEHSIEVRPLTILAGANSSGKSSIMQPLLLMKQTLEAPYDPGALLLDGPNVKFTRSDQIFSKPAKKGVQPSFATGLEAIEPDSWRVGVVSVFSRTATSKSLEVVETTYNSFGRQAKVSRFGSPTELLEVLPSRLVPVKGGQAEVSSERCFLQALIDVRDETNKKRLAVIFDPSIYSELFTDIIHVPGLRGNPQRTYPLAAVSDYFPGTFENYSASVIYAWRESPKLEAVTNDLRTLGLTSNVTAKQVDETKFELQVGRLLRPSSRDSRDLVNIADVGFGVSQTLPVVVAIHTARPGQLVYIEQPEIHLHPRAQTAMAQVLADAAMRGARLVIETHSDLILLGIQTLVAEGKLPPELVKLHWFERDKDGMSKITSRDLDERGRFGDWPEDFGNVQMAAQRRYLDAAEFRGGAQ